ncbi:MAG: protein-glutamate O-methyltransferase family protein [Anaerolineae bacterium]|nr:protein-glutamate O-methyltransferase family protein [Anaerolineae bacterium]NUQ05218.1 protein-glutamate O-methyltransferase family protein [Anaerolineae bacterium]
MTARPAAIRTDHSNPFAHNTIKVRLPAIVREMLRLNPDLSGEVETALELLARSLETDGPIPLHADPVWAMATAAHAGETWQDAQWFFAETYFYRLIADAVWWQSARRDPFVPHKLEEITGKAMRATLSIAFELTPEDYRARLIDRLLRALWGNRIDLSLKEVARHGAHGDDDDLLVDDRPSAADLLLNQRGGEVHVIADNTGTELAMDWLLIDTLLESDGEQEPAAEQVIVHVKAHPTFVSDATRDDALTLLAELGGRGTITRGFGPVAAAVAERLQHALMEGRLVVREDPFWNSPSFLFEMPEALHDFFSGASLVIQKGDANYRRSVGDALWDPAASFQEATAFFPAPLLALRTLKSDSILGLPAGLAEALAVEDPLWRVNGRKAVIQLGGRRD